MAGDMILYSVIALFVLFVFVVPPFLYTGLKRIADPVPLYLPALLAGLVLLALTGIRESGIISEGDTFTGTVISFFLLLLFVDLAVIAPFPYFEKKIGSERPWMVFTLLAFFGAALLFYMTMGHAYYGRPMPPFSAPLPLTGWVLDGTVAVLGVQDAAYAWGSPVYPFLREIGLFLEVLIITLVYYGVLAIVPKPERAGS